MRKKQKSNRIILLALLWMVPIWQVFGQDLQIQGKVTDSSTGEALPGVSIALKGSTKGTTTNANGTYSIAASKGSILIFSFIGYLPEQKTVESAEPLNVALVLSAEKLGEVVVIGYGTVKKSDATGAVNVVSSKDINKGVIASPQEMLVGKMAGVNITSGGGAPGSGFTIRIRGGASLNASNDPLIVIDGVPIDNNAVSGMANPLASLNPGDIESFTVLKDASATAIYGSRASNGVVLITTKKGANKMKFSYSGTESFYTVPKTIDVMSGDEFRALINQMYPGTTGNDAIAKGLLGTANTDWQKEIYQNAWSHDHNMSLSGTVKKIPYRASIGYTNQDGILRTDNIDRWTGAVNLSPSFLDDHLHVNANIKGVYMKSRFANTGAIGNAVSFDPTQSVYQVGSKELDYFAWLKGTALNNQATANPVAQLELTNNRATVQRSIGNMEIDYKFHFLPDLKINVNAGYDYSITDGNNATPPSTSWTSNFGGTKETYSQNKDMELLEIYLNYTKQIDALSSKIDVTAGHSYQHFYTKNKDLNKNDAETVVVANTYTKTQNYLESYFARLNYALMDKYLLTMTIRNDISSRFSSSNRSGIFPSAAFAWKINKETFLASSHTISDLKLRLGYGSTGQQDIVGQSGSTTRADYPYLGVYSLSTADQTAYYQFGNAFYPTLRPEGYDVNIKWETTNTFNIGFDYGLFNNKITGTLDYYDKKTKDLLSYIAVPAGTNLTNMIYTNVGDMENKGFEFSVNAKIINGKNWQWELGYNFSYNQNKITKLTKTDDPNYQGVAVGLISGGVGNNIQIQSVGYAANAFYVQKQVYDSKGYPVEGLYADLNKDGVINSSDFYRYKKPAPDVFMGISSKLSYKKFDFSFSGRASLGNYVYNNMASSRATYINIFNSAQTYLSNVVKQVNDTKFVNPQYFSDYYVENGSFFRMDYMSLGYNIMHVFNTNANIRVNATVQNAFIITKYKGLDPEVSNGIDNNLYPRPRIYQIGLNLDF